MRFSSLLRWVAVLFFASVAFADTPSRQPKPPNLHLAARAERGDAPAQFELAVSLVESSRFGEAVRWFAQAAAQGHRLAQCNLGAMYEKGLGVPKNLEQALYWYRSAADQGDEMAMYNLGNLFATGFGAPRLAAEWFERSAEKGYPAAQVQLGMMYWQGQGVERNPALSEPG